MDDQAAAGERGPETPPEPARADPIAGGLVTETLEYDGGRQVTLYVPPDPPEAVVFAGDGQGISQWGGFLEAADVPSTMIVGVHGLVDETSRLHEYSPVFDAERFAAHEKFFVNDVRRWVRLHFGVVLPIERTAVFGVSAGGEFALAIGLRHPDIYGAVFSGSPGAGYKPTGAMPSSLPRVYLEPVGFELEHILYDRDHRVITGQLSSRMMATGRLFESMFSAHITVSNGLITRYRVQEDSWGLVVALNP